MDWYAASDGSFIFWEGLCPPWAPAGPYFIYCTLNKYLYLKVRSLSFFFLWLAPWMPRKLHGNCNDFQRGSDYCLDFLNSYLSVRYPPVGPSLSEFELAQICLVSISLSDQLIICVVFRDLCSFPLSLLLLIRFCVFPGNVSFWSLGLVIFHRPLV